MPTDAAAALSRSKRAAFASLIVASTLALAFLPVEWLARRREQALLTQPLAAPGLALMRANPHGGGSFRLKPGLDTTVQIQRRAFRIRTNSHGLHWREIERAKPEGLRRVAFLGDSFTFGCWAPSVEQSFVGVFEQLGNRRRLEALNFGVGGYGLDDMELLLEQEVFDFQPDWIIVALFNGNDFRDTWLGLDKYDLKDGTARLKPGVYAERVPAEFRDAPSPRATAAPDPSRVRRALKGLATFRLLLPALGWDNPWVTFKASREFTSFGFWSQVPPPPVAREARDALLARLERMAAAAEAHGARLGVLSVPTREQLYCASESGADFDVQLPQAWVRVHARDRALPYLDLWPALRRHVLATGEQLYLGSDIHFNGRGHALAGELIRTWFTRELQPLRARPQPRPE
jgi:GDSL-like Lipase/Acylhydrolase family